MTLDFALSYNEEYHDDEFVTIADELRARGLSVELESSKNEPYASLEWLIPTAVFIFIAEKYFGTFIQEAAKEHYPSLRGAVKRIAKNVFRRGGTHRQVYAVPAAKVSSPTVHVLSLYVKNRDGRLMKFLLDETVPVDIAVDEIFRLLDEYYASEAGTSYIDAEAGAVIIRRSDQLVFKREQDAWHLCYPTKREPDGPET